MEQSRGEVFEKADPFILVLEAWQFISLRTRCCLERYAGRHPASGGAWVPIAEMRLSHLTAWTAKDLLLLPNFGRVQLCEVAMAMARYGFHLRDGGDLLDPGAPFNVAAKAGSVARATETKRVALERRMAMVRLKDRDGMTLREIAGRYGVSTTVVGKLIRQTRPIATLCERYPLEGFSVARSP